jgi:MFS family permease
MAERRKGVFRRVLGYRDFRMLLGGFAISQAGDWLYNAALIAHILEETGSPGWVAAASVIRLGPYIAFGAIGGAIGDRYDRRTVMLVCDVSRGALMLALGVAAAASAPVGLTLVLVFLSTTISTAFEPAAEAMIPGLVEEDDLAAANAASSTIENIAIAVGPAIGGILTILGSAALAFAINGVTFLASAVFIWNLPARARAPGAADQTPMHQRIAEGLTAIKKSPGVGVVMTLIVAAAFAYGEQIVLLGLVSSELLDTGTGGVGFLFAAIGAGGIIAAGTTGRLAEDPRQARVLAISTVALGLPVALLAWLQSPIPAYIALAISGAGGIAFDVVAITLLQRLVPEQMLARIFGVLGSVAVTAMVAGTLIAPPLVEIGGLETALVVTGLLPVAIVVALLPRLRSLERTAQAVVREFEPVVETLRGLGIFEGATPSALERLARGAQVLSLEPGAAVIREGEPADHLYIVKSGTLDVRAGGTKVNSLGTGDYFGEIGLVEQVPRTATVEATSRVEVLRVDGDDFLGVLGVTSSSRILSQGIAVRLARTRGHEQESR